jgi:hypothetical protein
MEYIHNRKFSKLQQQPYFYPPKYAELCEKKKRYKLYDKHYPNQDCFIDPYYPERKKIFNEILRDYNKNKFDTDDPSLQKRNWQKSLQRIYTRFNIKTPYNYYDNFFQNILKIINSNGNYVSLPYSLYDYIDEEYNINFIPDPFHSFFSMLDFCIFELFTNKHSNLQNTVKFSISDENLVKFIYLLVVNGYIGITQFRFVLYFSILYRNEIFEDLINQVDHLETPLGKILANRKINVNIYKRLLLEDALEFAYTQFNLEMVRYLIEELKVPHSSISERIVNDFKSKQITTTELNELSNENMHTYKKYYT